MENRPKVFKYFLTITQLECVRARNETHDYFHAIGYKVTELVGPE